MSGNIENELAAVRADERNFWMPNTVKLYRHGTTLDTYGGRAETWTLVLNALGATDVVPARIVSLIRPGAPRDVQGHVIDTEPTYKVNLPSTYSLNLRDRILCVETNVTYEVLAVEDAPSYSVLAQFWCMRQA